MLQCLRALLDFAYLARRSSHDTETLLEMEACLSRFHQYRTVFQAAGIRGSGFDLPRQHSLVHYVRAIFLYGSPNGLCSSITESKHIDAVKRPWRRSRRYKALLAMLVTNTRMSKIAAARSEFGRKGMLTMTLMEHAQHEAEARRLLDELARDPEADAELADDWEDAQPACLNGVDAVHGVDDGEAEVVADAERDVGDVDGPVVRSTTVTLSVKPGASLAQAVRLTLTLP
jgi:hypothetical protein